MTPTHPQFKTLSLKTHSFGCLPIVVIRGRPKNHSFLPNGPCQSGTPFLKLAFPKSFNHQQRPAINISGFLGSVFPCKWVLLDFLQASPQLERPLGYLLQWGPPKKVLEKYVLSPNRGRGKVPSYREKGGKIWVGPNFTTVCASLYGPALWWYNWKCIVSGGQDGGMCDCLQSHLAGDPHPIFNLLLLLQCLQQQLNLQHWSSNWWLKYKAS